MLRFSEKDYNKYKRNEITLNRESYEIRLLINEFMENFLKEKGVKLVFTDFDENDFFAYIKQEKLLNNDQSKLKWLSFKINLDKKSEQIGCFSSIQP